MSFRRVVCFASVVCFAGCTPPGRPGPDEVSAARSAIINGEKSDTSDDSAIAIPLFQDGHFAGACSGVLVAPNLVLTARHCVSETDALSACDEEGNALYGGNIYADRSATDLGVITGATIKFELDASGVQVFTLAGETLCNSDIALILLDKAIPGAQIAPLRLDAPPVEGETFRAVGWGESNNSTTYGRRRRDDVPVLQVGPANDTTGLGGIGKNEFEVGESICQGDSGGPAYAESTKAVIGVVSRGGNGRMVDPRTEPLWTGCIDGDGYTTHNLYTRVDGFRDLLDQAFAAAGTEPWREGGPDPRKARTGEPCASTDACRSGLCVEPGASGYCTQTCEDGGLACPEGMSCGESGDLRICKLPSKGCDFSARGTPGALAGPLALLLFALWRRRRRFV